MKYRQVIPKQKGIRKIMSDYNNQNSGQGSGRNFCPNCGAAINPTVKFCDNCGTKIQPENTQGQYSQPYPQQSYGQQPQYYQQPIYQPVPTVINNVYYGRQKDKWVAFLLCFFLGAIGVHKFYEGKVGMGILYLFTAGLFGIGWLVDCIVLLCKPNPYFV